MPRKLGRTVVVKPGDAYLVHHLSERLAHVEKILASGELEDWQTGRIRPLTSAQRERYVEQRDNLRKRLEAND